MKVCRGKTSCTPNNNGFAAPSNVRVSGYVSRLATFGRWRARPHPRSAAVTSEKSPRFSPLMCMQERAAPAVGRIALFQDTVLAGVKTPRPAKLRLRTVHISRPEPEGIGRFLLPAPCRGTCAFKPMRWTDGSASHTLCRSWGADARSRSTLMRWSLCLSPFSIAASPPLLHASIVCAEGAGRQ